MHPSDTALVLIDVQVNMFGPDNPVPTADVMLERLTNLLARARSAHLSIIFVRNCGGAGDPDERGAPGWHLPPALQPADSDVVVDKTTCDTFASTHSARN
ncbi:MAG TPA: isochorismatase family protein [Candidatus Limnocylindria bacterium]|nr:isochorismatase family protein [Candidatus Limnocylindria bacterium]